MTLHEIAGETQIVVFRAGREHYALPTSAAREVIPYEDPRRLPGADAWVLGVINLRGEIIPVCDLESALGLAGAAESRSERRIIVCDAAGGSVGLVVDEVQSVLTIGAGDVTRPPTLNHPALAGVVNLDETLVVVLDLQQALDCAGTVVALPDTDLDEMPAPAPATGGKAA